MASAKKRVAVLNRSSIHYSYGGISPFIKNLDPFLSEYFDIDYIFLPDRFSRFDKIPKTLMYFLYILFNRRLFRRYAFVISHVPESSYLVSFYGVPYMHIYHGNFNPMSQSRFWYGKYFMKVFEFMFRRIRSTADLQYTVGNTYDNIPKILNPIHHHVAVKENDQRKGFIFSGRLEKIKNIDKIISVYAQLPRSMSDMHPLYIAGMGTQEETLRQLAKTLGIENKVHFTGNLPNEQLIERVSSCKVLLMASSQEGFPMAIAEAFSVGVPVVTTDPGDIATYVRSGYNGELLPVQFDDRNYSIAIENILGDYNRYAVHAMESSRIFNAANIAGHIYEDILSILNSHAYSFHT